MAGKLMLRWVEEERTVGVSLISLSSVPPLKVRGGRVGGDMLGVGEGLAVGVEVGVELDFGVGLGLGVFVPVEAEGEGADVSVGQLGLEELGVGSI